MILTILLTVILVRRKVLGTRKGTPKTPEGTLPYDHPADFGYASPDEIRKCKISTSSDYTEPFSTAPVAAAPPPLTTFPRSSFNPSTAGDSGVGSNKRMADYYICTLIPNAAQPQTGVAGKNKRYKIILAKYFYWKIQKKKDQKEKSEHGMEITIFFSRC